MLCNAGTTYSHTTTLDGAGTAQHRLRPPPGLLPYQGMVVLGRNRNHSQRHYCRPRSLPPPRCGRRGVLRPGARPRNWCRHGVLTPLVAVAHLCLTGSTAPGTDQVPPSHRPLLQPDTTLFYGCGYRELPDIGRLEVSDDGITYRPICSLRPKYQALGGIRGQTIAFPTTTGRYFRLRLNQPVKLANTVISARARIDRWEERAALTL